MSNAPGTTLLNGQTALLAALLLGFVVLFGAQSWRAERADQIRNLQTVMKLSEKAIDRYFVKIDAAMTVLVREVAAAGGEQNLNAVHELL
jgi:predicted negative regulator of RcsB-dependent stress response